jgi:mono/diheme cytochrome c family protein
MKPWTDLFLSLPLPEHWLRAVLFVGFGLHLLFALLMMGTAMLGLYFFLHSRLLGSPDDASWNRKVAETHLGLKSLAVVLGVAPLLVIQVSYSEEFFTATGIFAYAWLAVIPLLIVAFLSLEAFGHRLGPWSWLHFALGTLGLAALLTVPAIFTGAMSLLERPGLWAAAADRGVTAVSGYTVHWLFRYLHILGAAAMFGGAFQLFFSAKDDPGRAARLGRWILAAALFQVVVGVPLLASLDGPVSGPALVAITLGAAAAMAVIWLFRAAPSEGAPPRGGVFLLLLLPVVFAAMLAARQVLQDEALVPARDQALAGRARQAAVLAAYQPQALEAFNAKLVTVYDNGPAIYAGSCQPCHGQDGAGSGPAARGLLIPAEDLRAVRADREYVRGLLIKGIPGADMPYFTIYDRDKIDSLLAELDTRFAMFAPPGPAAEAGPEARHVWATTCAACHGLDGAGNIFGATLRPAPPDLTRYALEPARALAVISDGYPGTVMQPYRNLPDQVRADLAGLCAALRRN